MKTSVLFTTIADDRSGRKGGKYSESQDKVLALHKANPQFGIDKFAFWKWADIVSTPFYRDNRTLLDHPDPDMNGRCYKPFIILEGLKSMGDGDFVIYNDISPGLSSAYQSIDTNVFSLDVIKFLCAHNGGILSSCARFGDNIYDHTHENFTTETCMNKMGMQEYRHGLQHASGMMVFQKSKRSMEFVEEWLHWNLIDECASLGPVRIADFSNFSYKDTASGSCINGVIAPNRYDYWDVEVNAGFGKIGHRHDQSISGLLVNKLKNKLVKETDDYCFLNFCRKGRNYEFIESNQPPTPYKLKMRHGTKDGTDGTVDRIPR
jgi:hypothetical protein